MAWALGLGLAVMVALLATAVPYISFAWWFLASLCHETGHCTAAWIAGCPAWPAISLQGHARADHQAQSLLLAFLALALWPALMWVERHRRALLAACTAGAVAHLLVISLGPLRDSWFLYAGHLGELAFAGYFLLRSLVGGMTEQAAERPLSAMVGWLLVFANLGLAWGLIFSASVRNDYRGSGSFGLTNDLVRLAEDVWGTSLAVTATPLLLLSLLLAPALLAWAAWHTRRQPQKIPGI